MHRAGDWTGHCVRRRAGSVRTTRPESTVVGPRSCLDPRSRGVDYLIAALTALVLVAMEPTDFRDGNHGASEHHSGHLLWAIEAMDGVGEIEDVNQQTTVNAPHADLLTLVISRWRRTR
jgi:hypothetical protein